MTDKAGTPKEANPPQESMKGLPERYFAALKEIDRLNEALDHIANPIAHMQAEAKRYGMKLNGQMAVQLAADAHYLREIAQKAMRPVSPESSKHEEPTLSLKDVARERDEFKAKLRDMQKNRDGWKSAFEMYRDAWFRELGGKVFNKHHEIDGLVLTTRWLREQADKWVAYENGLAGRDPFWMVPAR